MKSKSKEKKQSVNIKASAAVVPKRSRTAKPKAIKKPLPKKVSAIKAKSKVKEKTGKQKPAVIKSTEQEAINVTQASVLSAGAPVESVVRPVSIDKAAQAPVPQEVEKEPLKLNELELVFPISVKDLSVKLQVKPSRLIQELIRLNIFATINQLLSQEDAARVCGIFGFNVKTALDREEQILLTHRQKPDPESLRPRPAIVTFMGHVDHGKTSLLDVIRKTKIVDAEHGGITQHIGAYEVNLPKGKITFLDTPGHEAFTAMRSHGAHITDIVVLVVAADDGVMPQTSEAIDHARAANVPIIVAINKIDKAQADVDRVKKQLDKLGLTPEDWGGKNITVGVSAKSGQGVDELLEMIILEAEMLELKADYRMPASGVVIESRHDRNRGPLSTLLVENGTLRLNDNFISGLVYARVKAMFGDRGQRIEEAPPGTPVEVLGLTGLPEVGKEFFVVEDEKQAREIISIREEKERRRRVQPLKRISLEDLHSEIKQGKIKELKIILKADVGGSLEAVQDSLEKLQNPEIKFQIVHGGIGSINASDAMLAKVTDALILGFHVQPDERAKDIIDKEGIEVRTYNIIYELISEFKSALEGMLEPKIKKVFLGQARIRKVFNLSRSGVIAGCIVIKGKILRSAAVILLRNDQVVFEGKISSLKRFKDDVREVADGFECGISLAGFNDYQEGDIIEAFEIEKIARTL
ncbi:MAG: translation initiation factor IF-2 [Candidatus Omnitrophota bacterium]